MDIPLETLREAGYVQTDTTETREIMTHTGDKLRNEAVVNSKDRQTINKLTEKYKTVTYKVADGLYDQISELKAEVERLRELLPEVRDCCRQSLPPGSRYKTVQLHVALLNSIVKELEV